MVSGITRTASGLSPDTPKELHVADRPVQQPTTPDCSRGITPSYLEVIKRRQQVKGSPEEISQLLAAGWSRGTNTTYQSAWKRLNGWCSRRRVDPNLRFIQPLLEFLTSLFKEGLHYWTNNTIRSAVSITHDHIEGVPMG